jgi:spore germination protein
VVTFAKTIIPPGKLIIGIPLYGYDWTKNKKEAKPLTFSQIAALIEEQGASVSYESQFRSPYFTYQDESGREHQVWFENQKSLAEKIDYVGQAGLDQICFWRLGGVPQNDHELLQKTAQP